MEQDDHTRIRVGEHEVGVMGLRRAIEEVAESCASATDEEVERALLEILEKKNYIARPARGDYGRAFVREFRKSFGEPVDEEVKETLDVQVLGPGCYQCDQLEQTIMRALGEMDLPASVEHITDIKELSKYGLVRLPALVINGRVVVAGTVPTIRKIKDLLNAVATERDMSR